MVQQPSYWKVLTRRKILSDEGGDGDTKLNRVLGLYDLTALGVGSTLGAGVYVLAGQIAKEQAGPSVMLSFAIAALASLLAGVCYAEFGARVPKAGSAYIYSYVCIGEFAAFVIGWNLILEYVIGTASVCRGISLYLDTLINDTLKETFAEIAPMHISFMGDYFDFFACGLVVVFGVALAFGVETSAIANNFCTCLNLSVLLFVIIAGAIKANFANWTIDVSTVNDTTTDLGAGGFFPFGFTGTLKGAATCFFGFVGFDCIATTGEEVRNPRKNIPRSILLSLLIIFLCYCGVSTVLTLMVPYYLQDANAPLPAAFEQVGWNFAMWIVAIGGLIGLFASLFGALFPLPRVMYSMAEDGLLFRFLGKISPRYRVPVEGSIFAAILTSLIAGLFNLAQLVSLLSIGTLLAYSVVAISVTILRYMDNSESGVQRENGQHKSSENSLLTSNGTRVTCSAVMTQLFNCKRLHTPNTVSTRIVGTLITLFCILSAGVGLIFMQAYDALISNQLWVLVLLIVLIVVTLFVLLAICLQPREAYTRLFRVPFVPIVPAISIFINIYLMLQLDFMTWIRFGVWMIIGIPMFLYCWCKYDIKNPNKRNPRRIAFEKALRQSSGCTTDSMKRHLKNDNIEVNDNLNSKKGGSQAGSIQISLKTQNEYSIKSLDEIMNMNEVSDDLIEMKHPNGIIFYIEDNKSNSSNTTAELNETELRKSGIDSVTTDEEKSVIAMLDDVLQAEDEPTTPNKLNAAHEYSRKNSADSEMLPSVIETTTVATVHSSNEPSELDVEETKEIDCEQNVVITSFVPFIAFKRNSEIYKKYYEIAKKLLDEILDSDELLLALKFGKTNGKTTGLYKMKSSENLVKNVETSNPIKSAVSESAIELRNSIKDPLHSQQFRNKLSQLIMQPPPVPVPTTTTTTPAILSKPLDNVAPVEQTKLKHSKSEIDLRQLLLKSIEDADINAPNAAKNINNANGAATIPRPPKFDPVLYNTINSVSLNKSRPNLDKLLVSAPNKKAVQQLDENDNVTNATVEEEIPFKLKLEAVLQRGPSHRTQQRPDVQIRRPKSLDAKITEITEIQKKKPLAKSANDLSDNNEQLRPLDAIINARKTLRTVKNNAVKLER